MKLLYNIALMCIAAAGCACSGSSSEEPSVNPPEAASKWHLIWQDDFAGDALDESVWSRIPQGSPDWQKFQSTDPRCLEIRDGKLLLKAIVNADNPDDSRPYICGGIWTSGKKRFAPGSIKVRARVGNGAQGAWPAIWMMPFAPVDPWPTCGEIDIMERLNHETTFYQTLHSNYTYNLGITDDPVNSMRTELDPMAYHEFEVQIWTDRVDFYIDGRRTLRYPKKNDGAQGQFPYFTEWDLRLDMQLGGSWVGSVDASQLPVEMEIDWVKYYQYY